MGLQQFVRQTQNALPGDKIQAKEVANGGHAMIMWVREFKKGTAAKPLKTKFNPAGDAQLVTVDFVDLSTNEIKLNVAFFNETISDQLRPYAEKDELSGETREAQPLPLKFVWVAPKDATGNAYICPEGLEGEWLTYAEQWLAQYPTIVDEARAARIAEYQAAQATQAPEAAPAAPAGPPLGFTAPVAAAPAAPVAVAPPVPPVPQAPAAPVAPPVAPAAPVAAAPPAPPQAPAAPVPPAPPATLAPPVAAAPGRVQDQDVDSLLAELNG